jgi:hypothetical protein
MLSVYADDSVSGINRHRLDGGRWIEDWTRLVGVKLTKRKGIVGTGVAVGGGVGGGAGGLRGLKVRWAGAALG